MTQSRIVTGSHDSSVRYKDIKVILIQRGPGHIFIYADPYILDFGTGFTNSKKSPESDYIFSLKELGCSIESFVEQEAKYMTEQSNSIFLDSYTVSSISLPFSLTADEYYSIQDAIENKFHSSEYNLWTNNCADMTAAFLNNYFETLGLPNRISGRSSYVSRFPKFPTTMFEELVNEIQVIKKTAPEFKASETKTENKVTVAPPTWWQRRSRNQKIFIAAIVVAATVAIALTGVGLLLELTGGAAAAGALLYLTAGASISGLISGWATMIGAVATTTVSLFMGGVLGYFSHRRQKNASSKSVTSFEEAKPVSRGSVSSAHQGRGTGEIIGAFSKVDNLIEEKHTNKTLALSQHKRQFSSVDNLIEEKHTNKDVVLPQHGISPLTLGDEINRSQTLPSTFKKIG